jgi:hypothetical protein
MPPQEKKPKAKDDKARKQQAHDLVIATAKERMPDLTDEDVQVWSTAPTRGDGEQLSSSMGRRPRFTTLGTTTNWTSSTWIDLGGPCDG